MTFANSKLMKCPFCNGDAEIVLEDFENGYVHCIACGAKRPIDKERMLKISLTAYRDAAFDTWHERPIKASDNESNSTDWLSLVENRIPERI